MKSNRNVGLLVLAMASIAVGGAVSIAGAQTPAAAAAATSAAPMRGHEWRGHHGGMLLGMTLRATRQLNLTPEQKASIKSILANARAQMKAAHASGQAPVDMAVLANPGDPNYATALQSAKTLAANRIQIESEVQGQIYNVLTAEQKAQLPTVLASMKAQAAQRRANWEQKHGGPGTDG
jgi:Spy/CpxP family protein refolding chaperone